jgi:hypothetical protein
MSFAIEEMVDELILLDCALFLESSFVDLLKERNVASCAMKTIKLSYVSCRILI